MADMKMFEQYYQAFFGHSLKSRDVWYDFVKNCDELTLKNAMDTLEEVFITRKHGGAYNVTAPTFGEVKREYRILRNKGNGKNKKFCHDDCSECDGIGAVRVVIDRRTAKMLPPRFNDDIEVAYKPLNPRHPVATSGADLGITQMPCTYAFAVDPKHKGRYHGWSLNRLENECWMFIALCDGMWKKQQAEQPHGEQYETNAQPE